MHVVVGTNKNKRDELRKEDLAYKKDMIGNRCTQNRSNRGNETQLDKEEDKQ